MNPKSGFMKRSPIVWKSMPRGVNMNEISFARNSAILKRQTKMANTITCTICGFDWCGKSYPPGTRLYNREQFEVHRQKHMENQLIPFLPILGIHQDEARNWVQATCLDGVKYLRVLNDPKVSGIFCNNDIHRLNVRIDQDGFIRELDGIY